MTNENVAVEELPKQEEVLVTKETETKKEEKTIKTNTKEIGLVRIVKAVLFLICAITIEIIAQKTTTGAFLPKWFLFDFSIFLLLAGIIFAIPKNWISSVLFVLFLVPMIVLNILNIFLKRRVEDYFVFNMLSVIAEGIGAFDFYNTPFELVGAYFIMFVFLILVLIFLDVYLKKKINIFSLKKFSIDLMVLCSAFVFMLTTFSLQIIIIQNTNKKSMVTSAKELWNGNVVSNGKAIKTFGLYGFYINNFYNTYLKSESFDKQFLLSYISEGEKQSANENATLFNDNLILINVESMDSFALDPYNTPNLWKLMNGDGIYMSQFYGKNQTNVSETISMLGYMVNNSIYDVEENALSSKYSLANLFNEQGYKTSYFHPFFKDFYSREDIMDSVGFQNTYFAEDIEAWMNDPEFNLNRLYPENDFFEYFKEEMIPTDGSKFFSYYMTVATHGDYSTNPRFEKYYETFDNNYEQFREWFDNETDYTYPDTEELVHFFENYKAHFIETDELIGNMIKYLEETEVNGKKLSDSTTIILFGDHDCYYFDFSVRLKANTGKDDLYNIPMMMYSKKIESQVIDDFCSTYDIYPTICELFGLKYNENMCLGDNIFSEDFNSVFYSVKESVGFVDSKFKLLQLDRLSIRDNEDSSETEEEFMAKVNKFLEKQKYLNQIYKSGMKC